MLKAMTLHERIRAHIEQMPIYADIAAHNTGGRCCEITPIVGEGLRDAGFDVLLAETRYITSLPGAAHYYLLVKEKGGKEVLLVDPTINQAVETLPDFFIGTLSQARNFIDTHIHVDWGECWRFDNIFISPPANGKTLSDLRREWGEFGPGLRFNTVAASVTAGAQSGGAFSPSR